MNEQTTQLIEQLAQKLGTTTEYLWGILVKQAPISAITNLTFFILMVISGVLLYKLHRYLGTYQEKLRDSVYGDLDELAIVPMFVVVVIWCISFLVAMFSLGGVVNGFFNPEFWALKEVLNAAQ